MDENEEKLYGILEELQICYTRHEHPPVFTVEEAGKYWKDIPGVHCKNLFLRDKKGKKHYLVVAEHSKHINMKSLGERIGGERLSFASPQRLKDYLGLESGAVSPFGLINDKDKAVKVIVDKDLKNSAYLNFHPNTNTATITLKSEDFFKFLDWCRNEVKYLSF
ncbi:MAG: prolyl-tRNA synthetase associated domain-containing protein [Spirochaetes bacterium]|nr:MAG: prolyl-tRNA synthetase associated domain-containing protein [Spirochaetota bacterium]